MKNLTLNEKINNRSWNSSVEKYKGNGGLGFSSGVYGDIKREVIENGGSNLKAFKRTQTVEVRAIFKNSPMMEKGFKK